MEFFQAERGRTFILRLEHGEILHEEIEKFAKKKNVKAGILIVVGGANKGSELIVGPENRDEYPVIYLPGIQCLIHFKKLQIEDINRLISLILFILI